MTKRAAALFTPEFLVELLMETPKPRYFLIAKDGLPHSTKFVDVDIVLQADMKLVRLVVEGDDLPVPEVAEGAELPVLAAAQFESGEPSLTRVLIDRHRNGGDGSEQAKGTT